MTRTIKLITILLLMVIQHGGDDVSCKRSIGRFNSDTFEKEEKLAKNNRKTPDRRSGGMGKDLFNRPIVLIKLVRA